MVTRREVLWGFGACAFASGCQTLGARPSWRFAAVRARYERELYENVVPFWVGHSVDRRNGGFLTCLDRDGSVYDTFKEMWLQWREVYMFARLANANGRNGRWVRLAVDGFDFLVRKGRRPDGSYVSRLDRTGTVLVESAGGADVFTNGFAAMGAAELYHATGDERFRAEAMSCWKAYCRLWKKHDRPYEQLAHRMIGLNVMNVFREAFGSDWLGGANRIAADIRKFHDARTGLMLERRLPDGSFDLSTQDGRFVNPGHVVEGCSFLCEHWRTGGDRTDLPFFMSALKRHFDFGWDRERDGGFVYRDACGLPVGKVEWMLKTWWAGCEAATAMLRAYELTSDVWFWEAFCEIDDYNWTHFRDEDYPEWFAYASVEGRIPHRYKGNARKGFFHLPRHLADCIDVLRRLEGRG